ncbi:GNAT family N-acetyltransferase [Streptomyces sp. M10(2022)]
MLSTTRATVSSIYVTSVADTEEQVRPPSGCVTASSPTSWVPLDTPLSGHDVDDFDDLADHLIITDTTTDEVVGTYRLMPPGRAEVSYSETEFDLRGLHAVRSSMIEAGRACVHPDYRSGAVINLLWAGLARYTLLSGRRYLAGCASVPLADGGRAASSAWLLGTAEHAAPAEYRVRPTGHGRRSASARPHPTTPRCPVAPRLPPPRGLYVRSPGPRPGVRRRRLLRPAGHGPAERPLPPLLPRGDTVNPWGPMPFVRVGPSPPGRVSGRDQ